MQIIIALILSCWILFPTIFLIEYRLHLKEVNAHERQKTTGIAGANDTGHAKRPIDRRADTDAKRLDESVLGARRAEETKTR